MKKLPKKIDDILESAVNNIIDCMGSDEVDNVFFHSVERKFRFLLRSTVEDSPEHLLKLKNKEFNNV